MDSFLSDLINKNVLILGASGSIGKSITSLLLNLNCNVYASSKREQIELRHENLSYIQCDCTRTDKLNELKHDIKSNCGSIDAIIFCIGVNKGGTFQNSDFNSWKETLEVNLDSLYLAIKTFYSLLNKKNDPVVVIISSMRGIYGGNSIAYSTSKSALNGFILSLASNIAIDGIRVVGIAPGPIESAMLSKNSVENIKLMKQQMHMKELLIPEDVANLIAFLISNRSRKINGTVIEIADGFLR